MDEYIKDLHELCETISEEIGEANKKIKSAGGKLTAGDVDYIDKLTHTLKSVKATIAMMDEEGGGGYSERSGRGGSYARGGGRSNRGGSYEGGSYEGGSYEGGSYEGGSYEGGSSGRGGSYARGRRYARRDSMGRYSREGDLSEQIEQLMEQAPNEQIKREMEKLARKIEEQM